MSLNSFIGLLLFFAVIYYLYNNSNTAITTTNTNTNNDTNKLLQEYTTQTSPTTSSTAPTTSSTTPTTSASTAKGDCPSEYILFNKKCIYPKAIYTKRSACPEGYINLGLTCAQKSPFKIIGLKCNDNETKYLSYCHNKCPTDTKPAYILGKTEIYCYNDKDSKDL